MSGPTSLDRRVVRPPQLRATGGRAGEGELPTASRPLFPPTFSARRLIDDAFIWNARRKRLSQPFTIITIDGGGVSFGYVEEKRFAG